MIPDRSLEEDDMDQPVGTLSQFEEKLAWARRARRELEEEIVRLEELIAKIKLQPLEKRTVENIVLA